MTEFNFEHFFNKTQPQKAVIQKQTSLDFLKKDYLPPSSPSLLDETSITLDLKQFFKPTLEDKKQIIEDFLMWAHEKEISADNSGTLLMYIRELKGR